jgi:hypothetical protein
VGMSAHYWSLVFCDSGKKSGQASADKRVPLTEVKSTVESAQGGQEFAL